MDDKTIEETIMTTFEKLEDNWKRVEAVLEKHGHDKSWVVVFKYFWTEGYKEGHQAGFNDGVCESSERDDKL